MVRILILLLTTIMAWTGEGPGDSMSAALPKALLEMTKQASDKFVIVEDSSSGKFIQFEISPGQMLLLDIPKQQFSVTELAQSSATLKQHGLKEVTSTARDPKTNKDFESVSFQMEFEHRDAAKASELTILLHEKVFRSKAANLAIVRGWE